MLAAIFVKGLKQCFICVKQRKKIHMHAILVTQDINGAHVRVGGRCIWMVNGVVGGVYGAVNVSEDGFHSDQSLNKRTPLSLLSFGGRVFFFSFFETSAL